jgi:hypothetical protein
MNRSRKEGETIRSQGRGKINNVNQLCEREAVKKNLLLPISFVYDEAFTFPFHRK